MLQIWKYFNDTKTSRLTFVFLLSILFRFRKFILYLEMERKLFRDQNSCNQQICGLWRTLIGKMPISVDVSTRSVKTMAAKVILVFRFNVVYKILSDFRFHPFMSDHLNKHLILAKSFQTHYCVDWMRINTRNLIVFYIIHYKNYTGDLS